MPRRKNLKIWNYLVHYLFEFICLDNRATLYNGGNAGYVNVKVNINQYNSPKEKGNYFPIALDDNVSKGKITIRCDVKSKNGSEIAPHAMFSVPFDKNTPHIQMSDKDTRNKKVYSNANYPVIIGHEMGHILGIDDGYANEERHRQEAQGSPKEIPKGDFWDDFGSAIFIVSSTNSIINKSELVDMLIYSNYIFHLYGFILHGRFGDCIMVP